MMFVKDKLTKNKLKKKKRLYWVSETSVARREFATPLYTI
mgnify:CR=1 FL=1